MEAIDASVITELKEIMGDGFPRLVESFFSDADGHISALHEAVRTSDFNSARNSAHSFKGSSSSLGALDLSTLCQQLEQMGRSNQLNDAPAKLEEIETEYKKVQAALNQLIA